MPAVLNGYPEQSRAFIDRVCTDTVRNEFEVTSGKRGVCDEYPFSTTFQGGPAHFAVGGVSLRMVPKFEQSTQGGQLSFFYGFAGVARDGRSDLSRFIAIAVPGSRSFAINRSGQVYKW